MHSAGDRIVGVVGNNNKYKMVYVLRMVKDKRN